ncbi:MAG: polyphosphate kinase 2 [Rhizobiaceae bacterium]|nr:polyphosphate kinase 2 [Rhizobiaceae bacterium]
MADEAAIGPVELTVRGRKRVFDIRDPKLPGWVDDNDLTADDFPYKDKMDDDAFEAEMHRCQLEIVKMLGWMAETGERAVVVFEGRDAAGKGGTIAALRENMNPRQARNVALPKPTDAERKQWYFQRYASHMPTAGELVTFDRSWYNRAGVEPVMGFCTPEQHKRFLADAPEFEELITREGIHLIKLWLNIAQETQLKRFHDRWQDPLKRWKFSPIDVKGMTLWDAYSDARDLMLQKTHSKHAPWTVIRANDKRRLRLAAVRAVLAAVPYAGKDDKAVGTQDKAIAGSPKAILGIQD